MPNARNARKADCRQARGQAQSGYNKETIRSDIRYLVVSKDVRRHRLISIDYITTVTAEVASSSLVVPAISFKNLPKVLHFRMGTKRHKIGTGNRAFPSRAYVSCVFSRNKSATTASCAFRFSVVTACVYVSRVTRIVEWRSSSCMIFSSAPVDRSSVE
jgi:hypothetical protein